MPDRHLTNLYKGDRVVLSISDEIRGHVYTETGKTLPPAGTIGTVTGFDKFFNMVQTSTNFTGTKVIISAFVSDPIVTWDTGAVTPRAYVQDLTLLNPNRPEPSDVTLKLKGGTTVVHEGVVFRYEEKDLVSVDGKVCEIMSKSAIVDKEDFSKFTPAYWVSAEVPLPSRLMAEYEIGEVISRGPIWKALHAPDQLHFPTMVSMYAFCNVVCSFFEEQFKKDPTNPLPFNTRFLSLMCTADALIYLIDHKKSHLVGEIELSGKTGYIVTNLDYGDILSPRLNKISIDYLSSLGKV